MALTQNDYNKRSQMRIRREAKAFRSLRTLAELTDNHELARLIDQAFDKAGPKCDCQGICPGHPVEPWMQYR